MLNLAKEGRALAQFAGPERIKALKRIIPARKIKRILAQVGTPRLCPAAPNAMMVWLVIGLGFFAEDCYRQVWRWLNSCRVYLPQRSTLCMARQRLGLLPLARLADQVIVLLATPKTPGAFYNGLRLMAIDTLRLSVPDSPDNRRTFGPRRLGQNQVAAFPQVNVTALVEAGTHVIWKWQLKPCHWSDVRVAPVLLRHLQPEMLLMWDCNFFKYDNIEQVQERKAHLLVRISRSLVFKPIRVLSDGSYLSKIYRNAKDRRNDRDGIVVRIIEYTFDDPNRSGCGQSHRLLTTLLDETQYPARELVVEYHQRWEEELTFDEVETHQLEHRVLRSQTPAGVVQEIYGLFLSHYVVRCLMFQAAALHWVDVRRISFTGALKILRCRLPEVPASVAGQNLWWRRLVAEVSEELIEPRRNRANPRVLKRTTVDWPKKREQHYNYPQPTKQFGESIVILR